MIRSKKKLSVSNANVSLSAIVVIKPRFENTLTDFDREIYNVDIQFFYMIDDIQHPIEQTKVDLPMMEVISKTGGLRDKIIQRLIEHFNDVCPYGSTPGDWEKES